MQPEQIQNRRAAGVLEIDWDDGVRHVLTHAVVRAACRCTQCQAARLRGTPSQAVPGVLIEDIRPMGHYAVQLVFTDGHERGIYPWQLLREIGETQDSVEKANTDTV